MPRPRKKSVNLYRHKWESNNNRENDHYCKVCQCRRVVINNRTTYKNKAGECFRYAPECKNENAMAIERINTDTEEGKLLLAALGTLIMQPVLNIGGTIIKGTGMSIAEMLTKIDEVKKEMFKHN